MLYDNYPNAKLFVSGSNSLFIEKKTRESLGGRTYTFQLLPLHFAEYLKLKGKEKLLENARLFQDEIKEELDHYVLSGGFPELLWEENPPSK